MTGNTTWKSLVGHSVLIECFNIKHSRKFDGIKEYIVDAVSPSGLRVKFLTTADSVFWAESDEYRLVEDLGITEDERES